MSTNLRVGNIAQSLLATLLACGVVACTSSEPAGGTGGSGGSGGAGDAAVGAGGSTGVTGVLCPTLAASITDFDTATAPDTTQIRFGGSGTQSGGASVWGGLTSALEAGAWHLSGTVADYAGFNVYFDSCTRWDASAYKGISFTLSGGATNVATPLNFAVTTVNDTTSAAWLISQSDTTAKATDVGSCTPTSGNGRYYHPGCADPAKSIDVPAAPTTITVLWSDLLGGQPDASPKPDQITGIYWNLPWTSGSASYAADFTIDNLKFIP